LVLVLRQPPPWPRARRRVIPGSNAQGDDARASARSSTTTHPTQAATPQISVPPQYSIPIVFNPSESEAKYYDLSLRDTLPFEVDGALAVGTFIE